MDRPNVGTARIIRADSRNLPLDDNSVDLVVTSPPYFGLRSYQDGGTHYAGQIGDEPTPQEFIDALLDVTRECVRVLKLTGSLFVNLGDKYATAGTRQGNGDGLATYGTDRTEQARHYGRRPAGFRDKSLMLIPQRYAIACVDQLGLILRAEIIWSKCLSGGTVVYARTKGRESAIRLHDLCRAYKPEDVELWTGERWSRVRAWEPTPRGEEQYELELRSGERIGCTAEHRWPTHRGILRSDELAIGDILDTARLPEGSTTPGGLDDEMIGWFVGLYIAEGSRSEQTIQISGHVRELDRFERLTKLAQAYHGTCRVHATGGNSATINLTGGMLRAILDTYVGGRTAKDKHLQPKCWQRSNTFLRAVLDGYLSGDGHWREDANRWIVGFTDNDLLASDLRTLGARLGLSVRLSRCVHTGFGKQWPGWRGNITEPQRRRSPDSQIVALRPSRARQFWDVSIEDEPHLFALASGVLTHNSNGLPESVTDRVRRSHEQWWHFTLQPRYYSAVDEIREGYAPGTAARYAAGYNERAVDNARPTVNTKLGGDTYGENPLGKLPGSVWTIPTQPLKVPAHLGVDHFAAFPMEWPRRIIRGWSPAGVCTACREGRRPVAERHDDHVDRTLAAVRAQERVDATGGVVTGGTARSTLGNTVGRTITGERCACPDTTAPTTPGVVLDPFGGTGTTALMAKALGRDGISVDMSADYCRLAEWRTTDPGELARAMQVEKPEPVMDGQLGMFEDGAA